MKKKMKKNLTNKKTPVKGLANCLLPSIEQRLEIIFLQVYMVSFFDALLSSGGPVDKTLDIR